MKNAARKSSVLGSRQNEEGKETFDEETDIDFKLVIKICIQKILIPRRALLRLFCLQSHIFTCSLVFATTR